MGGIRQERIREDLIPMLEMIALEGGTDCTGTCHHRRPGEFHCHTLARRLHISSQGVKNRILELVRLGLLARHRIERQNGTPLFRFMVTDKGRKLLEIKHQAMSETDE